MNEKEQEQDWCLHKDTQKWFEERVGMEPWVTIYKPGNNDPNKKEDLFIWSFLIRSSSIKAEMASYQFEQFEGIPTTGRFTNGVEEFFYKRSSYDDRERLFFQRRFTKNIFYAEMSQEFVLFFNLHYSERDKTYLLINADGSSEPVIKLEVNGKINLSLRRLKQFLAFKQMSLVVCVSCRRFFNEPLGGYLLPSNGKQVMIQKSDAIHYAIWYQEFNARNWRFFSELMGKKIISPMPLEETDIYPFEHEPEFEKFIIGQDENGNPVEFECNPQKLDNMFGENKGNPYYLTPVFFSKGVLSKYYNNPELYKVQDGHIEIGDYLLRADTNHEEYVIVFLGDLGRDIPFSEQKYWKSFNIPPIGKMSKTAYERNILGEFSDPESEQFIFKNCYEELLELWTKKFGWPLFKPVNRGDSYRLETIRIPLSENQQEFDQQVEAMVILLVDSINKEEIDKITHNTAANKSIGSLEILCSSLSYTGYEPHIAFLKELYSLRSRGSSHRKGSTDYAKMRAHWKIDEHGLSKTFRNILTDAISLLRFFIENAQNG